MEEVPEVGQLLLRVDEGRAVGRVPRHRVEAWDQPAQVHHRAARTCEAVQWSAPDISRIRANWARLSARPQRRSPREGTSRPAGALGGEIGRATWRERGE